MADAGIKKITIPLSSLPQLNKVSKSFNITNATTTTASGTTTITFTTATPHYLTVGELVNVTGVVASGTNGFNAPTSGSPFTVLTTPSKTTFTVSKTAFTGTYTSGGVVLNVSANYIFRYRIISEDKVRVSSWSPIYSISAGDVVGATDHGKLTKLDNGTYVFL